MNISYNWLKRYLDTDLSAEQLAVILTDIGLEVEGLEKIEGVRRKKSPDRKKNSGTTRMAVRAGATLRSSEKRLQWMATIRTMQTPLSRSM